MTRARDAAQLVRPQPTDQGCARACASTRPCRTRRSRNGRSGRPASATGHFARRWVSSAEPSVTSTAITSWPRVRSRSAIDAVAAPDLEHACPGRRRRSRRSAPASCRYRGTVRRLARARSYASAISRSDMWNARSLKSRSKFVPWTIRASTRLSGRHSRTTGGSQSSSSARTGVVTRRSKKRLGTAAADRLHLDPGRTRHVTVPDRERHVRIGVIGYGYWGPNLVRNFALGPRTKVVAIAEQSAASPSGRAVALSVHQDRRRRRPR